MYTTLVFAVPLLLEYWNCNVCALSVLQLSAAKQGISIVLKYQHADIQKLLPGNILFLELFDTIEYFPETWEIGIFLGLGLYYTVQLREKGAS